jgi:broad specificity phosphatase PhoE
VPIVFLIRHAQASFGADDYDVLSDLGRRQVEVLGEAMSRRGVVPDLVVTGSLRRQRDTSVWASAGGARTITDVAWNEYDDGNVLSHHSETAARVDRASTATGEKLTSREFQVLVDDALHRWVDAGEASGTTETWPQFVARITGGLERVADELRSGQTGLVFSSSGVIGALTAALTGAAGGAFVRFNQVSVNTAITKVIVGSRGCTLVSFNEHSHLDEIGAELVTYR